MRLLQVIPWRGQLGVEVLVWSSRTPLRDMAWVSPAHQGQGPAPVKLLCSSGLTVTFLGWPCSHSVTQVPAAVKSALQKWLRILEEVGAKLAMTLPPGQMSLWLWPVSVSGPAPHFIITLLSKTPVKWRARPSPKVCGRFRIFLLSQTQIRYCFTSIRDTSEGLKSKCHLLSMSFRPGAVLGGRACPVSVILCYRLWIAFSAEDGRWLTNFCGATPGWSVWCVV